MTGPARPRDENRPVTLSHTSPARDSVGCPWVQSVVTFPAYPAFSQPLLEKCFNRSLPRSTHDRRVFHASETRRKPVFSRSGGSRCRAPCQDMLTAPIL